MATIWAARSRTGTFVCWEARRSLSNASDAAQRDWAMMIPLACSITGMVSSRASNRAFSDCCSRSRPSRVDRRSRLAFAMIRWIA